MGEAKMKAENKKEAFEANPDDFLHVRDVLFVAMRGQEGQLQVMNNCLSIKDCMDVQGWAVRQTNQRMDAIEIERLKKAQPTIIPAGVMPNGSRLHLK